MRRSLSSRGFTLIELLVASAIAILVIATASTALITQYKAMETADLNRLANGNGRTAVLNLERSLRTLGWGVDPRYAIDFKYRCAAQPCRDKVNGPDELVFVSRDPLYRWEAVNEGTCTTPGGCFLGGNAWPASTLTAGPPTDLRIVLPKDQVLHQGQVMLASCQAGMRAAMFTLSAKVVGTGSELQLPMAAEVAGDPYNHPNGLNVCAGQPTAVFLVDRYRYFIQNDASGTPWLMLDTGLDLNDNGTLPAGDAADLIPVAKGVEDMQVAYVLNSNSAPVAAPDSDKDWVIGDEAGSTTPEEPLMSASAPDYRTPSTDAARFSMNPANVRGVRVSLVLRSERSDQTRGKDWTGQAIPNAENRSGARPAGPWRRYTAETEVSVRNMDARLPFIF